MKCLQCGREIQEDSRFCVYCGQKVSQWEYDQEIKTYQESLKKLKKKTGRIRKEKRRNASEKTGFKIEFG